MDSVFTPEDSYGLEFAQETYKKIAKQIKIDPIQEGLKVEKEIYKILNPSDYRVFENSKKRTEARKKADSLATQYIKRSRKFWKVYQAYVFNRGKVRAHTILTPWIINAKTEQAKLEKEQEKILNA